MREELKHINESIDCPWRLTQLCGGRIVTQRNATGVFPLMCARLSYIIIKFPYNVHSDCLEQRALSENRERVDDGKLAFKFFLRNFDKFDPN